MNYMDRGRSGLTKITDETGRLLKMRGTMLNTTTIMVFMVTIYNVNYAEKMYRKCIVNS